MSANLDLVRSIFAAWERADYSTTDWAHGEIEFVIAEGPSPGRWTGLAEMAEGYRDWLTAWEAYRVKADEYLGAGVPLVWIVNPDTRSIEVLRADGSTARLREAHELSGEVVLPGFTCRVGELFAPAAAPGESS